ncbi:MAG: DUF308 domain-containing protein [Clostridia bacterium]|nr:DUF308 domain-containing protein [Clostridia bacterium]
MRSNSSMINAVISIVTGILFIVKKGEVISLITTLLGVAVLIMAIIDLVGSKLTKGIIEAAVAGGIMIFGWFFVSIALYIIAAVIIISAITELVENYRCNSSPACYIVPLIGLAAGVCLFFNQGGAVAFVFTVTGILLIVRGAVKLIKG